MFELKALHITAQGLELTLEFVSVAVGGSSRRRVMDAGTSRPSFWFFQSYNVCRLTPTFWATERALSRLEHKSITAARFCCSDLVLAPELPVSSRCCG